MEERIVKIFRQVLLSSDKKVQIKLLGDSITHGVGGTGFAQDGEPIVEKYARNPNGYCWAHRFKAYMEEKFHCEVTNNACTGTRIEFIIDHFDELVDAQDDLVICTIGTNNRHQYFHDLPEHTREEHLELFYQNILKLHKKFVVSGKQVIFVANIPASAKNEEDGENYRRLFHMEDVCRMYEAASEVCGFPLLCLYKRFLNYCAEQNITVDSLLKDGLHPNDAGYDVMFILLKKAFLGEA